jgi:thiamine biosynthesis lipoprotein
VSERARPAGPTRRDALRIGAVVGVGAALGETIAVDVLRRAGLRRVAQTRVQMGTLVTITVVHPESDGARALVEQAFAEMERLESALTRHRPAAPLGRLNARGRIDRAPEALHEVVRAARELAGRSGGAFDPTVLPVLQAWERAWARGEHRPASAELDAAHALVGFDGLHVRGDGLMLEDPGMGVTLDGIAKGFIVDRTLAGLVGGGADRVLVNAGGDIASGGSGSRDEPWTVALQHPREERAMAGLVRLADAIATSGDYQRSFSDDRSDHHIIDPRTGRSPPGVASVSVTASTAMEADGFATALLVLGPEEGRSLVEGAAGLEAMIVGKDGTVTTSAGFDRVRA